MSLSACLKKFGKTLQGKEAFSLQSAVSRAVSAGTPKDQAEIEAVEAALAEAVAEHQEVINAVFAELPALAGSARADEGAARGRQDLLSEPASKAKNGSIEDFGNKITGARKDYMAAFRERMAEAMDMDIAEHPLSKTWPEPDYQKLLDDGADPWAVAFAHASRDEVPTKPQSSWKLKDWVAKVTLLRSMTTKIMSGEISAADVRKRLDAQKSLADVADRAELYTVVGHDKSLKGIGISYGKYGVHAGIPYDPPKIIWSVNGKAKRTAMSYWPKEYANGDNREEAIENFKKKWAETEPDQEKTVEFDIYSRRNTGEVFIGKKIGGNVVTLKGGFKTTKEARAWKAENQAELVKTLEKFKYTPNERRENNSPRVGEDHRNGADVTPEQFKDTFGFRGGQFGNSMPQDERQSHLNEAYDALMDMAGVLGIPAKALSLNGELGLAFGARGRGGKGALSAHYERDTTGKVTDNRVVINLTRERGAGALAHEWFHAVDNYFARMMGRQGGMVTDRPEGEGVRTEMLTAFRQVMAAIDATGMPARSRVLDAAKMKPYWSTKVEMAARAYESYVVAKLQDQNASNDYLANIVSKDFWDAAASLGMEKENTYPYPDASELPKVRAAFDAFFQTVETKETDRGTAMFSRADIDFAANFVTEMAAHDELFRHSRSVSSDLGTVFSDVAEDFRFMGDDTRADERTESGADRRYAVVTPKRKVHHIYERGNEVWIDVGRSEPGDGGNYIYAAVLNYAKNAKKVLIGDPATVSQDAVVRRTVAMLSSALRFGTTRHMKPAAEQSEGNPVAGIAPLEWGTDEVQNLRNLIDTFLQTTYNQNPEIEGIRYDFASRQFVENGKPVTRDRINGLAETFRDRTGRSGQSSIRRAALLQSLVRSESGERPGLLEDVFRRGAEHVSRGMAAYGSRGSGQEIPGLKGVFSRNQAPERGLSTSEQQAVNRVRDWLAPIQAKLKNIPPVEIVYDQSQIPAIAEKMDALYSKLQEENDHKATKELLGFIERPVEGAYIDGKIWMVASSLLTQQRAIAVFEHEGIGHLAVQEMLDQVDLKLMPRLVAQVQMLDKGGNRYIRELAGIVDRRQPGLDAEIRAEEIIALIPERGDQAKSFGGMVRGIYQSIMDGIRAFYKLVFNKNLSDADVRDIVAMAERWAQGDEHVTAVIDGKEKSFSLSRSEMMRTDQTQTEAFRDWFGESKVVDSDGKPLVVYHGTNKDFDVFDTQRGGELGSHFGSADQANKVTQYWEAKRKPAGNKVLPVYLSIKNPLRLKDYGHFGRQAVGVQLVSLGIAQKPLNTIEATVAAIEAAGHDGVVYANNREGDGDSWIAFKPEQIKSAVGNNGQFDPGNPDIRFSRPDASTTAVRSGLIARARELSAMTGELGLDEGVLNAWNKTVGTPELVARKNESFAKVFWEGQNYLSDVNRFVSEAEEMLPSWFKGQDILSRWFDRVRGKEVAQAEKATEALLDGTLANEIYTDAQLTARGLSAREIGMYREARTAIDAMIEKVGLAVIAKVSPEFAPQVGPMMGAYRAYQQDGLEAMMGFGETELKAEIAALQQRKLAGANVDAEIRAAQARLEDWQTILKSFERIDKLQKNGYFPLSRFGSHYVNVTDDRGETVEFRMYETDAFAKVGAVQMSKKYPSHRVTRGTVSQNTPDLFKGLTPESVELFAEIAGMSKDPVMQQYLKEAVASRSMLKRMIHRKGTPGYSKDAVRVLADFISSNGRYWSRLSHFDKLQEYAHDIKGGELRDYAINLVKYLRGDDGREEFQGIRGFLFFQYIGGNVSSALLNLSQVPMFTAPWLMQHTNAMNVGRLLTKAYGLAIKDPRSIQGPLGDALRLAEEEGITDPQNVYTTMAIGSGSKVARIRAFSGLLDAWAFLFSKAETLNRRVSFIAAYELATGKGMKGQEAFDFAVKGVQDSQFIYNKGNRPQWARGIGAIPFTFKIFTVAALETIFAKLPPKQAAILLALMFLAAGLEGLPFAEDLEDVLDGIGQKLGYPTNSKRWLAENLQLGFKEWMGLSDKTAHYAAEMVRKGVFANTPLASLGSRVGMGNLIPGTAFLQTGRDVGQDVLEAIGPAAGFVRNVAAGAEQLARGEVGRAAEKALPSGVANIVKGARQMDAGEEVTPFGKRVASVSKPEAALQMIGVYPGNVSRTREREQMIKQDELYLKTVEDRIADKWASGVVSGDADKVREAREELLAHNERNPRARIRITPQQIQSRVKNMRRDGLANTIKGVAKERRAEAREFLIQD